jgi:hypothetical protein
LMSRDPIAQPTPPPTLRVAYWDYVGYGPLVIASKWKLCDDLEL